MADALISPAVGGAAWAVSAAAVAYSTVKIKNELGDKKVPLMAVAGAFVFAAQMINFTIPATGSSGHIGGGILLAGLLGAFPALLTIAAVLVIQCLCFADGGLLALGCNILNMGVIPCLVVYPLIFKPILGKGYTV
ncbi:MAG: energy-coupling factor ABC transporter permease, partial [Spirochaetaceae bacterium]|nr:energy-coupling factor ABC transporter permease [Spirochaetaceae bacterium]